MSLALLEPSENLLFRVFKKFLVILFTPLLPCDVFKDLNAELHPLCHLLALLGAHHIFHVSGLRVTIHVSVHSHLRKL